MRCDQGLPSNDLQETYRSFYVHIPPAAQYSFVLIILYQALTLLTLLFTVLLLFSILLLFAVCLVVLRILVALLALTLIVLIEHL